MSVLRFEYFLIITIYLVQMTNVHLSRVTEKCYEDLGCVKLTKEWKHRRYRPRNVLPADRHVVNTIFLHWTLRHGNATPELIGSGESALKASGIGSASDIRLLIHDFTSNGYTGWIRHLSHVLLLSKASHNIGVVSVNWAAGAEPPYVQAVANARLVALEVVMFLKELKTHFHLDAAHVHIIGHGLGGHIAGYVGKCVSDLRHITALDPSGPHFRGMPPNVKLHIDDAKFVEVIHTDCGWGGQGNKEITGHLDFFPNGGKHQPGCRRQWSPFGLNCVDRNDLKAGQIYRGCSHKRAFKYYIEALARPSCSFVGFSCQTYEEFLMGKCTNCGPKNEKCARIDPMLISEPRPIDNSAGLFFLTSATLPYCVESLKVTINIMKGIEKWHRDTSGYLNVTIPQTGGDVTFTLNEEGCYRNFRAGCRYTFAVFHVTPPVTKFPCQQLSLTWHRDRFPCIWSKHEMLVSNLTIVKMTDQHQMPQLYCGTKSTVVLTPNVSAIFHKCSTDLREASIPHHQTHWTTEPTTTTVLMEIHNKTEH